MSNYYSGPRYRSASKPQPVCSVSRIYGMVGVWQLIHLCGVQGSLTWTEKLIKDELAVQAVLHGENLL